MSSFLSQPLLEKIQNAPFVLLLRYLMYITMRRVFNHPKFLRFARRGEKFAGFRQFCMLVFPAGDEKLWGFDLSDPIDGTQGGFINPRAQWHLHNQQRRQTASPAAHISLYPV